MIILGRELRTPKRSVFGGFVVKKVAYASREFDIASAYATLELILSTHDKNCLSCSRSTNCELQKLCLEYGVDSNAFGGFKPVYELDYSTPHLVRDNPMSPLSTTVVTASTLKVEPGS